MTFTKSNFVEAHLCDLLAGAASPRPTQFLSDLERGGRQSADTGCCWRAVLFVTASAHRGQI